MKDCSPGADEILLRQGGKWGYIRYHPDANGNVKFLLDNDGQVVEKYTYDVFGRPKITDAYGNPRDLTWWDNRFLFQGREYIGEVGVYDYRNRFYHPSLGRFLQKDPTGFDAGDMNLFRYCGDDPIDGSDPTGLDKDDPQPVPRPLHNLTSWGRGDWIPGANGLSHADNKNHFPAGNITVELVPAGDRNQHVKERLNKRGERMSGETVPSFKVLDPVQQKDGSWKVTSVYTVDVYYADGPGSTAGPKTMAHTYNTEWQHAADFDTKFYAHALKTVSEMNRNLKFDSPEAAKRALEGNLRGRFNQTYKDSRERDDPNRPGNHVSPFKYEE